MASRLRERLTRLRSYLADDAGEILSAAAMFTIALIGVTYSGVGLVGAGGVKADVNPSLENALHVAERLESVQDPRSQLEGRQLRQMVERLSADAESGERLALVNVVGDSISGGIGGMKLAKDASSVLVAAKAGGSLWDVKSWVEKVPDALYGWGSLEARAAEHRDFLIANHIIKPEADAEMITPERMLLLAEISGMQREMREMYPDMPVELSGPLSADLVLQGQRFGAPEFVNTPQGRSAYIRVRNASLALVDPDGKEVVPSGENAVAIDEGARKAFLDGEMKTVVGRVMLGTHSVPVVLRRTPGGSVLMAPLSDPTAGIEVASLDDPGIWGYFDIAGIYDITFAVQRDSGPDMPGTGVLSVMPDRTVTAKISARYDSPNGVDFEDIQGTLSGSVDENGGVNASGPITYTVRMATPFSATPWTLDKNVTWKLGGTVAGGAFDGTLQDDIPVTGARR